MKKKVLTILGLLFLLVSCGPKEPDPVEPQPHEHTFAETYTYDEYVHWQAATCEHTMLKQNEGEHTFGQDNKCSVCGYEREVGGLLVPEANKIANITAQEATYTDIYGIVVAKNNEGVIVTDGVNNCYIYGHYTECEVGEYISITGKYTAYKGIKEFDKNTTTITKLTETAPQAVLPEITLTNEVLNALANSAEQVLPAVKYKWNTQIGLSGSYKLFNIEGCEKPIECPKLDSTVDESLVVGNYYDVVAYYYGTSTNSGGYHCFMIESFNLTKEDTYVVHECQHVCPDCGKCKDPTCTDPACAGKCTCIVVPEGALVMDFTVAGQPEGIVAKADSVLEELTFEYNDITYGYKGCCKHDTDYGNYFFMLGKEKKEQTCLYNKEAFEKEIKSIIVETTGGSSSKVVWCVTLGETVINIATESTNKTTGKGSITVLAGEGHYKYFNISTIDAANNLQIKRIIIEFAE